MAASLPNGATLNLATAYASPLLVTAVSNAATAVLTVTNSLVTGDYFEFISGWSKATNRIYRVLTATTTTINAEGLDTSNSVQFPAGQGGGTIRKINTFTQVTQILETTFSGGEVQETSFQYLENDFETSIPTITSASSLDITIADDASLAGYIALKNASFTRAVTALRINLTDGGVLLYNGIVALNQNPSLTKNEIRSVSAKFSAQNLVNRY